METKQKNSNWKDKTTVKKGNIGERLVDEYLINQGFIPYHPGVDGSHPFDRLVASRDKKTIFIADAKTKAKRMYYPDTGINISHYNEYKFIQDKYNIDVFIFFVDEECGEIYGNFIRELDTERQIENYCSVIKYPLEHKGIHYFPIINTKHIAYIPKEETEMLQQLTTKKSYYNVSP